MAQHIVQSPEWGQFKSEYGTPVVTAGKIIFTKHKIPFTDFFYGYCAKVDPADIDFDLLKTVAQEHKCVAINFDVPNVVKNTKEEILALERFKQHGCTKSPKNTFAKANTLIDISLTDEELLKDMHHKHRYNIKYAVKKGVKVRQAQNETDFTIFYNLLSATSQRQKYYTHPRSYYKKLWDLLFPKQMCHILIAEHEEQPLAAWMLFTYENVLYYLYGGMATKCKNLHASELVGWEAIKFGKRMGCKTFDMMGTATDLNDKNDKFHGFSVFKSKFGGKHIEYIDSYDLVLNEPVYKLFNTANNLRWKFLRFVR